MTWSGLGSAKRRRLLVVLGLVLVAGAGSGPRAEQAQQPAPAQQEPPDQMKFTADAIMLFFSIKPEGAADFEAVMAKVKEGLAASQKPERQRQAANWRVYKIEQQQQGGIWTYICVIDPVVKEASYDPFKILAEGLPPDQVGELYKKFSAGLNMPNPLSMAPVKLILAMGGGTN
jgi:hypothetical protein